MATVDSAVAVSSTSTATSPVDASSSTSTSPKYVGVVVWFTGSDTRATYNFTDKQAAVSSVMSGVKTEVIVVAADAAVTPAAVAHVMKYIERCNGAVYNYSKDRIRANGLIEAHSAISSYVTDPFALQTIDDILREDIKQQTWDRITHSVVRETLLTASVLGVKQLEQAIIRTVAWATRRQAETAHTAAVDKYCQKEQERLADHYFA